MAEPDGIPRDFPTAASAVVRFLSERLPFGLWMVTRTEGDDWIALTTADRDYGVIDGTVFRWSDSFCSRMVAGLGPRVAPRSDEVPAYRAAPIGQQVPIAAYIGVPIRRDDDSLFGTLCAVDKSPQPDAIIAEQPLIELLADLLGALLEADSKSDAEKHRAERAEVESLSDELTGLGNRRAWERIIEAEEARCARYGDPASVLIVDLDGLKRENDTKGHAAGDELLCSAAAALTSPSARLTLSHASAVTSSRCSQSTQTPQTQRLSGHGWTLRLRTAAWARASGSRPGIPPTACRRRLIWQTDRCTRRRAGAGAGNSCTAGLR
jgi:GAF domain-containing protein